MIQRLSAYGSEKSDDNGDMVYWCDYQTEIEDLKAKLLLAESQHYCKICGKTLDGYEPIKGDGK